MGLRRDEKPWVTGLDCWSWRGLTENFNVYLQLWIMSDLPYIPFHLTPISFRIFDSNQFYLKIFALSTCPAALTFAPHATERWSGVHQKLWTTFCIMLCYFNHKLEAVFWISQFITIQPNQPMNRNLNEKGEKSCPLLNLCNFSRPPHLDLKEPVLCYICHRSLTCLYSPAPL